MTDTAPRVIVIPPNPELAKGRAVRRQLRVAAYCRVSTDSEEQLTSYEAQQTYYTDKIMSNPEWTMAGIFADRGLTGTSAKKRPEFLRMIRLCRQKKIDIVLTKSISRFARNTVDCLNYIRALRELGIPIIFEEQNINTLDAESEMLLTMLGAFAQAESENMASRIRWGKQEAMREGKVSIRYKWLYGYEKGKDGEPKVIPEQAEIVREIYDDYLAGDSIQRIKEKLEARGIRNAVGESEWTAGSIKGILTNEKYYGDVLQQKTYVTDCISGKVKRNTGQLPMYLIENNHEGIISRQTFDAVQAEMARRIAGRSPSKKNATGQAKYSSKYALTERLVCGECGTLYRRCTWTAQGRRRIVWRCVSRLDYGKKYCHNSPTVYEEPLQEAILAAINRVMRRKEDLENSLKSAMEYEFAPVPGETMSIGDIDERMEALTSETNRILEASAMEGGYEAHTDRLKEIVDEMARLKEQTAAIAAQRQSDQLAASRLNTAAAALEQMSPAITEWDESMIRQLIDTVKVVSPDKIRVYFHGGIEIEQDMTR